MGGMDLARVDLSVAAVPRAREVGGEDARAGRVASER